MKFVKTGPIVFGILLLALISVAQASVSMDTLDSYALALRTALTRKLIVNTGSVNVSFEEIQKYDLNSPESSSYEDSKNWSIFYEYKDHLDFSKYQSLLDTAAVNGNFFVTLSNRIEGLGTDKPELLVIATNLREAPCKSVIKTAFLDNSISKNIQIPILDMPPNLLPHPQIVSAEKIIELPNNPISRGCVQAGGTYYYYELIKEF